MKSPTAPFIIISSNISSIIVIVVNDSMILMPDGFYNSSEQKQFIIFSVMCVYVCMSALDD